MVRLRGVIVCSIEAFIRFQFLHGAIKGATAGAYPALLKNFNSYMVRLREWAAGSKGIVFSNFNSYMVRLRDDLIANPVMNRWDFNSYMVRLRDFRIFAFGFC